MAAEIFDDLLTIVPAPVPDESIEQWWHRHQKTAARYDDSVDAAAATGAVAGSVGRAFGSGYQVALRRLVPSIGSELAALCVTETRGGHPRAIETTLVGGVLTGTKTFVTLGTAAQILLVACRSGEADGDRPQLRLVRVDADRAGVAVTERPPLPIVPDVPHGEVRFDAVEVATDAILEGDGYARFVKPFRTIEDIHVTAALVGWLLGVSTRYGWTRKSRERLLFALAGLRGLAAADPAAAATHIALGGALDALAEDIGKLDTEWATNTPPEVASMWRRDSAILRVAEKVRAARLDTAWKGFDRPAGSEA